MNLQGGGWTLGQFLGELPVSEEVHLSGGSDPEDYHFLTSLPLENVHAWLVDVGHRSGEMDDKARAAYLIGYLAWAFALNLAALHVVGRGVPAVSADTIAVTQQWYRWEKNGESGTALRFAVRLVAPDDATFQPLDNAGIGALAVKAFAPVVETLATVTSLGKNALWRLVSDSIMSGWLSAGKASGRETMAMQAAQEIIKSAGAPLFNKQVGFVEIALHDEIEPARVLAKEWFRARGGCCRYYTTPESDGVYCSTCVLNPPEARDKRLQDYMKGKMLVSA